jgi:4-hydroxy-tetrahydrodipicolinate synthase
MAMNDNTLQLNETDIDEIQHNSIKLSGTFTALVTPFTKDGNVDYDGLSSIVEFQIKEGIDGLLAVGTTGESPTLTWDEHLNVIQTVHECGGSKIKIIAGTGSNNTHESHKATKFAAKTGVDSALLIDPYYNGPSSLEIRREYLEPIARDFPNIIFVPYIIPGRTGTQLSPEDLAIAYSKFKNISAVKEATGDLSNARKIRKLCGADFTIFSGNDDQTLDMMLDKDIQANGVISVTSNILPNAVKNLVQYASSDYKKSIDINNNLKPLFDIVGVQTTEQSIFGNVVTKSRNPVPTKTLMHILGMPVGLCRQPLGSLTKTALNVVVNNAKKLYENTDYFQTLEAFFDIDLSKRLYSDAYLEGLYYESY